MKGEASQSPLVGFASIALVLAVVLSSTLTAAASYAGTNAVGPVAYLQYAVDDDNLDNSSGNDDGIANPGETIELYVFLFNDGADTAQGVYAEISTSSPYVTFLYNTGSSYPDMGTGIATENDNDFDFLLSPCAPRGHPIRFELTITASNGGPWMVSFDLPLFHPGSGNHVALISDQTELEAIAPIVSGMGLTYDLLNSNWSGAQGVYTSDIETLRRYCTVVWYGSGYGVGRNITTEELGALSQYLDSGGRLLATGYDTLGSPSDPLMADLVRSGSWGDGPFSVDFEITNGSHPISDGPYGRVPPGTRLTAGHSDHDQAEADTGAGAVTVAELADGHDKIIATELPSGGIVVYWNGNTNTSDWTDVIVAGSEPEAKVDAAGKPVGLPSRPQNPAAIPDGMYVVDGVLSAEPPPEPDPAPAGSGRQAAPAADPFMVIDFDDTPQPCLFLDTVALRTEYLDRGVEFNGPGVNDGGAVLHECGGFGVTGHSSPNFLAFNSGATLSDGGIPEGPEEIFFHPPVPWFELGVGSSSGAGQVLTVNAYDADGTLWAFQDVVLQPALAWVRLDVPGTAKLVISSSASIFVLDDLTYPILVDGPNVVLLKNTLRWLTNQHRVLLPAVMRQD